MPKIPKKPLTPSQSSPPEPESGGLEPGGEGNRLTGDMTKDLVLLREKAFHTADLITRPLTICGVRMALVTIENMTDLSKLDQALIRPLLTKQFADGTAIFDWIEETTVAGDVKDVYEYDTLLSLVMSGFVAILIDGVAKSVVIGVQDYAYRSVSEPNSEINERGSREGFTEPIKVNLSMIRRRMKSGSIRFELFEVGTESKTNACLVYAPKAVSPELLAEVRGRMKQVDLKTVLDTGYLQPYLEGKPFSLFSEVGTTERPDTLCAKVMEGRIAVLLDGTPYALIVPYLFVENFQSFDDYARRPYFATFIRLLKYISFFFSILLPGTYVAMATFHPAVLPHALLFNVASAEETTPFPLVFEAFLIHFFYEIMREAGLRLPRPVGHAVSIVGALVIGDAAVTSGIIGAPMVMVVALTAISSFVVPSLYEPSAILRFAFIFLGGLTGLFGIALAASALLVNICRANNLGLPYMAPISPFTAGAMRDVFVRVGWKHLGKRQTKVQNLRGSKIS